MQAVVRKMKRRHLDDLYLGDYLIRHVGAPSRLKNNMVRAP